MSTHERAPHGRIRRAGLVVALVAGLLAACAPATPIPGSPDDAAHLLPEDEWNPGIGGSDGILADPGTSAGSGSLGAYATFRADAGVTLSVEPLAGNCVRDEISGVLPVGQEVLMMRRFQTGFSSCMWETSWSRWRLTATRGADSRTATLELNNDLGYNGMQAFCSAGGSLSCDRDEVTTDAEITTHNTVWIDFE
ncbi:MAG: hypothetical protein J7480_06020 [Microbacteriaceae bacterium]|nr:hypothetical protein [Microbacteriaceae bacterium]